MTLVTVARFARLLAASSAATLADVATLLAVVTLCGLAPGPASVVGCLVGGGVNFAINRAWVFRGRRGPWLLQAMRYGVIVVGGGAVVSGLAVAALTSVGLPLLIAKAGAVVTALVAWTYPMSARVVFVPPSSGQTHDAAARGGERAGDPDAVLVLR